MDDPKQKLNSIFSSFFDDAMPDRDYDSLAKDLFVLSTTLYTVQTQTWILVNQMIPKAPFPLRLSAAKQILRSYINQWHRETTKNISAGFHFEALTKDDETLKFLKAMGRGADQASANYTKASHGFVAAITPVLFDHAEKHFTMLEGMASLGRSGGGDDLEGEEWKNGS